MDAKNLAFKDSFFDAVVAQYVITAVPDPEATLDDFIRGLAARELPEILLDVLDFPGTGLERVLLD